MRHPARWRQPRSAPALKRPAAPRQRAKAARRATLWRQPRAAAATGADAAAALANAARLLSPRGRYPAAVAAEPVAEAWRQAALGRAAAGRQRAAAGVARVLPAEWAPWGASAQGPPRASGQELPAAPRTPWEPPPVQVPRGAAPRFAETPGSRRELPHAATPTARPWAGVTHPCRGKPTPRRLDRARPPRLSPHPLKPRRAST